MKRDKRTVTFVSAQCMVVYAKYQDNDRNAIDLRLPPDHPTDPGEPWARASINIPQEPVVADEVIIKNYSENTGMLIALQVAGIVQPIRQSTYLEGAWICKMLPDCEPDTPDCPKCRSSDTVGTGAGDKPVGAPDMECYACGHEWLAHP